MPSVLGIYETTIVATILAGNNPFLTQKIRNSANYGLYYILIK